MSKEFNGRVYLAYKAFRDKDSDSVLSLKASLEKEGYHVLIRKGTSLAMRVSGRERYTLWMRRK